MKKPSSNSSKKSPIEDVKDDDLHNISGGSEKNRRLNDPIYTIPKHPQTPKRRS
ncbi:MULTISPECIES: hypothetical protein [Legionella]|uniref:Uncharacterized protein n=1 Tax=Legionella maceachernii TaxID=466 RepID=A0A0W0W0W2_9GAMM|nr:hypothetical protein [Legionella maceachernii]KTD26027.1 hypothetical protein Lmac_1798 [Legionella maceachernii]SJZ50963.1 hypothetical protein SAMN02745128_00306 [Legionella maceachernii]SUP03716.1 Uncharacterised protein [Legionella maceachernii]